MGHGGGWEGKRDVGIVFLGSTLLGRGIGDLWYEPRLIAFVLTHLSICNSQEPLKSKDAMTSSEPRFQRELFFGIAHSVSPKLYLVSTLAISPSPSSSTCSVERKYPVFSPMIAIPLTTDAILNGVKRSRYPTICNCTSA